MHLHIHQYLRPGNPISICICNNNPIIYWDPDGHVVTSWDKKNLSKSQIKAIENATSDYNNAKTSEAKSNAHAAAEAVRNTARSSNEVGSASGYTYTVSKSGSASLNKYDSDDLVKATGSGSTTSSGYSTSIILNGSNYIPERNTYAEKIITENFKSILPAFMPTKSTNNVNPNTGQVNGVNLNNLYGSLGSGFLNPIDIYNTYNNLNNAVGGFKKLTQEGKLDWFLMLSLAAEKGYDDDYHISQDYWQALDLVGYCKFYDLVFDAASEMSSAQFDFKYNKEEFRIWAWKGDYVNLGAGAELGIYHGGGPIWKTGEEYSIPMTLKLKLNGTRIINWIPKEDNWWITGFDPSRQDVLTEDLQAFYTLDFSKSKKMNEMYTKFAEKWDGKDKRWDFSIKYHPTFTFGEVK